MPKPLKGASGATVRFAVDQAPPLVLVDFGLKDARRLALR